MPISYQISKGSIFTAIAEYANEKDASLVVMGTHGMKGMQKLTGSWALKVIVKSKVPFIVVQDPPQTRKDIIILFSLLISEVRIRKRSRWQFSWENILIQKFICLFL